MHMCAEQILHRIVRYIVRTEIIGAFQVVPIDNTLMERYGMNSDMIYVVKFMGNGINMGHVYITARTVGTR